MTGRIHGDTAGKLMDHLDDDSIMRLVEKTDYETNAMEKAVKVLKSKENIFSLLEQKRPNFPLIGVHAMEKMDSDADIIRIMEIYKFDPDVCRKGIPLMRPKKKDASQILELMRMSGYNERFCLLLVANSNLSPQELVETLFELITWPKKAVVAKAILPYLNKTDTITVLGYMNYDDKLALKANWEVLDTEKEVINLFQKCYQGGVTGGSIWEEKVKPLLSLSTKSDKELFEIMNITKKGFRQKPDPMICGDCMRHLSTPEKKWKLAEDLNYHPAVLEEALSLSSSSSLETRVKTAEAIIESRPDHRVGQVLIAQAQNEKQALYILEKTKYHLSVFKKGIHLLSSPTIWHVLKENDFDTVLLSDALPYMNLENKSNGEIRELIQEVNHEAAQERFFPFLDLKNKTLKEVIDIAVENDFPESLCRVAAEKAELQEA